MTNVRGVLSVSEFAVVMVADAGNGGVSAAGVGAGGCGPHSGGLPPHPGPQVPRGVGDVSFDTHLVSPVPGRTVRNVRSDCI